MRTPSLGGQGALADGQLSRARFVAEATPCVQGLHCYILGENFLLLPFRSQAGMSGEDMQELRATVLTKE